ncbi:predicted protein [Paecilomyces variotii No. 5]|uniref:Uncharacterized protein n=1 Tax=Byssochlamys spectabilis (strain No. 5 / NBRC 109023) TaxID=1356009 RepID=V5FBT6_BYSSN|nr:predicted protein [Paecilomyces variotii No. 5]
MQTTYGRQVILQKLLLQPMLVSNENLAEILCLRTALCDDSFVGRVRSEGEHSFYVRSWTLTPYQLLSMVQLIREKGFRSAKLEEWEFQSHMAAGNTLSVRYIGMIKGRRDLLQRSQLDFEAKSTDSLFGIFLQILREKMPTVHDQLEIYELPQLRVNQFSKDNVIGSQLTADDTEQLLIQLFGHRTLLNLQQGGQYVNYLPEGTDETLLDTFPTRYFEKISKSHLFPEAEWKQLSTLFVEIKEYVHTKGYSYQIHQDSMDIIEIQARPHQYRGNTVIVFLGEELSRKHLESGCSFLNGPASASVLVREFIHRIKKLEEKDSISTCSCLELSRIFPFINALPLPGYKDVRKALTFLKAYLQCVKPVLLASYGQRSHATIASGFEKIYTKRLPSSSLRDGQMKLAICSYGPTKEEVFLHIPLSHPGRYQYGTRDPRSLRRFYISMQLTILIGHWTMEILEECAVKSEKPLRSILCMKILDRVKASLQGQPHISTRSTENNDAVIIDIMDEDRKLKPPVSIFSHHVIFGYLRETVMNRFRQMDLVSFDSLQQSSDMNQETTTVLRSLLRKRADLKNGKTCPVYGLGTFDSIFSLGRAHGEPRSSERIEHLQHLWSSNHRQLHEIIPHAECMREEWFEQFLDLKRGQSYFMKVLSHVSGSRYLELLSAVCKPPGRHKPRFDGITQDIKLSCGLWVSRKMVNAQRVELNPRLQARDVQGFPVEVRPDGDIKIKWTTSTGIQKTVTVNLRCAIPETGLESRALSFTHDGLDVVDANGRPIRPRNPWQRSSQLASFPRSTFASKDGQMLQELWEAVRLELGHEIPKDRIPPAPTKRKGIGLLPSNSRTERPEQNRPPRPDDANYLLYKFLNERFPEGGVFRTALKDRDPSSTEDLRGFVDFCKRPENASHPYKAKWLDLMDRPRPMISILAPNIKVLRSCMPKVITHYFRETKRHATETCFELGAPGSADDTYQKDNS